VVTIHPTRILGRWREGYALDKHTVSSEYLGDDEFGMPQYTTTRTEIGELLYQLKYKREKAAVEQLAGVAAQFLRRWNRTLDLVVLVPASRPRTEQPVVMLAEAISELLHLELAPDAVTRVREVPELKNVHDYDQRVTLLEGAHDVARGCVAGRTVLLFDDLYRSGATMNAVTSALYDVGGVNDVFALTITRTRSKA